MIGHKVILLGAHGTGRSTLAQGLAQELRSMQGIQEKDVVVVDGMALKCRTSGYKLNVFRTERKAHKAQLFFLSSYLRTLRLTQARYAILSDNIGRQYAYSAYNGMWPEWLGLLLGLFVEEVRGSTVLYIPIEFGLPWDELHHMSPEFQAEVDGMLLELLDEQDVDYHVIRGGSEDPETNKGLRVRKALKALGFS